MDKLKKEAEKAVKGGGKGDNKGGKKGSAGPEQKAKSAAKKFLK